MKLAADRVKLFVVVAILVAAHFALRPQFAASRFAPDLVLVALLFYAIRSRPGAGAIAGFVVGILSDAVSPTAFGAGAFALTIIGFAAGWLKAVVFADNILVSALFVFAATWLRDLLEVVVSSELRGGALARDVLLVSPLAALSSAAAAVVALVLFHGWLRTAPSR